METRRQIRLALFAGLLLLGGAGAAQSFSSGQNYHDLRGQLLREGWKPATNYGLRRYDNHQPLYRYPEVLCGPKLCRAKWRDRAGHAQYIMLIRGFHDAPYRVQ